MPYKLSIPLLAISILLHWLASNNIYVSIAEGGYLSAAGAAMQNDTAPQELVSGTSYGLSADAYITVGFSSGAILVVLCITILLLTIPIAVAWRTYKGVRVVASANSMVISAACHVSLLGSTDSESVLSTGTSSSDSSLASARDAYLTGLRDTSGEDEMEMTDFLLPSVESTPTMTGRITPERSVEHDVALNDSYNRDVMRRTLMAERKLRWGVAKMPPGFSDRFQDQDEVGHLAFGTENQEVVPPEEGRKYA